jgi:hypothetical protein
MASKSIIDQVIESRLGKLRNMGVGTDRHEPAPHKAQRIGQAPYYDAPANFRPDGSIQRVQAVGDRPAAGVHEDGRYDQDVSKDKDASWRIAKGGDTGVGNRGGEGKPLRGFVGSEHQAAHRFGNPAKPIDPNPSGVGPGNRRGDSMNQGRPIRNKRILGKGR